MTVILTQSRHDNFVEVFHRNVLNSPKTVTLRLLELDEVNSTSSFEDFTGTAEPAISKEVKFPCLFKKNEVDYDDSFIGFNNVVDGRIYLSPKQLLINFGTFRLDARQVNFILDGQEFNCVKVVFLEELFEMPIGIEFTIKDKLRG